jgi:hypothetical protein
MKRVIFTTFDDIKQGKDRWNVGTAADYLVKEYFDRLVENKKQYAEKIGVDFKFFQNTMKDFEVPGQLEFTKANLYKHHVMSQLADEYDEVMYCDMDVVFNTDENIFDELDLSKGIHIKDQDRRIENKNIHEVFYSEIGNRNPTLKYHITRDMLGGKENHVMNTGIMIAKSEHIKQIKFIERMPDAILKIKKLATIDWDNPEEEPVYLRLHYYANNESIFSYILEQFEVPYVIMPREWHYIVDHFPDDIDPNAKVYHFINKKFSAYFKDRSTAVFSIYIDIPDEKLDDPSPYKDDPNERKSKLNKDRITDYKDRLYDNHVEYCNAIGAEYLHYGYDDKYKEFAARFPTLSEYNIVNLYKVWLLDELCKEYDQVMYVDFDVYFRRHVNVFDYVPCEVCFCCDTETKDKVGVDLEDPEYFKWYNHDFRNPEAKYWNAHAMLQEEDIDPENTVVFNTGVMITTHRVMKQIKYFDDIEGLIDYMTFVKDDEDSMYHPQVRKSFGYDNETIMSYKTIKHNVPVFNIPKWWHHKNHYFNKGSFEVGSNQWWRAKHVYDASVQKDDSVIIHFISKNFSLVFNDE